MHAHAHTHSQNHPVHTPKRRLVHPGKWVGEKGVGVWLLHCEKGMPAEEKGMLAVDVAKTVLDPSNSAPSDPV